LISVTSSWAFSVLENAARASDVGAKKEEAFMGGQDWMRWTLAIHRPQTGFSL
jgi:hypothetical protein